MNGKGQPKKSTQALCLAILVCFLMVVVCDVVFAGPEDAFPPDASQSGEPADNSAEETADNTQPAETGDSRPEEDGDGEQPEDPGNTPDPDDAPAAPEKVTPPPETEEGVDDEGEAADTGDTLDIGVPAAAQSRSALATRGADSGTREPVHTKYVEPKADGSYSLSLEVTGDTEEVVRPADVVILFDCSGSTTTAMYTNFKRAARALADTLLTPANDALLASRQTRIAIVAFAESVNTLNGGFTASRSKIEQSISSITYMQPQTNWEDALGRAKSLLNPPAPGPGRADTRKYTLFLADGNPNYVSGSTFSNSSTYYFRSEQSAIALVNSGVTFYSLGVIHQNNTGINTMPYIKLDARDSTGTGSSAIQEFKGYFSMTDKGAGWDLATNAIAIRAYRFAGKAADAQGKYFVVHNETDQEYVDAFQKIANEIKYQVDYTNAIITDILSRYATLTNTVDGGGNITDARVETVVGGVAADFSGYTLTYDENTGAVTFSISGPLAHETTYRLTLDIIPSQQAYDELAQNRGQNLYSAGNGYPSTGQAETGSASANKTGFFSNDSAALTFQTIDSQGTLSARQTATPFGMPVIQLQLGTIHVQKEWKGDQEAGRPDSIEVVLLQDGAPLGTATLDKAGGWAADFDDIPGGPSGHTYSLEEVDIDEDYQAARTPDEIEYRSLLADSFSFTLANTRTQYTLPFEKTDGDGNGLAGAQFDLYRWAGIGQPSGSSGYVTDDTIADGVWTKANAAPINSAGDGGVELVFPETGWFHLVETQAPGGFYLPKAQWRFQIGSGFAFNDPVTIPESAAAIAAPDFEKTTVGGVEGWRLKNHRRAGLDFLKVSSEHYHDGEVSAQVLPGAAFELYLWRGTGTPRADARVTPESITQGEWQLFGTAASGDDGRVSFTMPAESGWFYQLVETRPPTNYTLPTGQWRLAFTAGGALDTGGIQAIPGENGGIPPPLAVASEGKFSGELTLTNIPEYALPSAGGLGKLPFVMGGCAMILAGGFTYMRVQQYKRKQRVQSILRLQRGRQSGTHRK